MRFIPQIVVLLLISNLLYAQEKHYVTVSTTLSNPRLLIFNENNKEALDSLHKVAINFNSKRIEQDDSLILNGVLSFNQGQKRIHIYQVRTLKQNDGLLKSIVISELNKHIEKYDQVNRDILFVFENIKMDYLNKLLFKTPIDGNEAFNRLLDKTRGNYNTLNISKLAEELSVNVNEYKDIIEN